ncbi:hypothetical protein ACFWBN_13910 [Streptomyces sp. NPDC059989]|uniref:hypothetical protein n=1 Tax=Streptomyces sp. NPDC059989 TaxID=3347026 RepID=UPI00369E4374
MAGRREMKEHQKWLEREWLGSEVRLFGACVAGLAIAAGDEWGKLSEREQQFLVLHFAGLRPTRADVYDQAREYWEGFSTGVG